MARNPKVEIRTVNGISGVYIRYNRRWLEIHKRTVFEVDSPTTYASGPWLLDDEETLLAYKCFDKLEGKKLAIRTIEDN